MALGFADFFFYDFICLFFVVLGVSCCEGFSLITVTLGHSLVAEIWLLIMVALLWSIGSGALWLQ